MPATVQFGAAAETVSASAGTFSIPVKLTDPGTTLATDLADSALAVDRSGNVYVGNFEGTRVTRVTPNGARNVVVSGLSGIQALAFDPYGNLFVATNDGAGTIVEVTTDGVTSPFITLLPSTGFQTIVKGLGFDNSGNLYASQRVTEFQQTFFERVIAVTSDRVIVPLETAIQSPGPLAVSPSGTLYVVDGEGTIRVVTPGAGTSTFDTGLTGFGPPKGLAFDGSGNLYLNFGKTIIELTPDRVAHTIVTGDTEYVSFAVDSSGVVYAGEDFGRIVKFTGLPVTVPFTLGGTAVSGTDFRDVTPSPLVFASGATTLFITGTLLSDPGPDQTLTITLGTPTNAELGPISTNSLTIQEPARAATVQIAPQEKTIDSGVGTFRVEVSLSGTPAARSVLAAGLSNPVALAFDPTGLLDVASPGTFSRVTAGGGTSAISVPSGGSTSALALDRAGNFYVADFSDGTVQKVTPGGSSTAFATGLAHPTDLAFDRAGNLYVANTGDGTISRIAPYLTVSTYASG